MRKAVHIGGWGCGPEAVENTTEALRTYYDEATGFTYSRATKNPDMVAEFIDDPEVDVWPDSAAGISVDEAIERGARPRAAVFTSTPLETTRIGLGFRGAVHLLSLHKNKSPSNSGNIFTILGDTVGELASNLPEHFGKKSIERIVGFGGLRAATRASEKGIITAMAYGKYDKLYQFTSEQKQEAEEAKYELVYMEGGHNWMVLDPPKALEAFMRQQHTVRPELSQPAREPSVNEALPIFGNAPVIGELRA
jgi:hypothetical protein